MKNKFPFISRFSSDLTSSFTDDHDDSKILGKSVLFILKDRCLKGNLSGAISGRKYFANGNRLRREIKILLVENENHLSFVSVSGLDRLMY